MQFFIVTNLLTKQQASHFHSSTLGILIWKQACHKLILHFLPSGYLLLCRKTLSHFSIYLNFFSPYQIYYIYHVNKICKEQQKQNRDTNYDKWNLCKTRFRNIKNKISHFLISWVTLFFFDFDLSSLFSLSSFVYLFRKKERQKLSTTWFQYLTVDVLCFKRNIFICSW